MSEKGALKNKKIEVIALVILAAFIVALGSLYTGIIRIKISYTRNIYRKML